MDRDCVMDKFLNQRSKFSFSKPSIVKWLPKQNLWSPEKKKNKQNKTKKKQNKV